MTDPIKKILHISIDGLSVKALEELQQSGELKTFNYIKQHSLWTHNARTDYYITETIPNHMCMFTSRGVFDSDCNKQGHTVFENDMYIVDEYGDYIPNNNKKTFNKWEYDEELSMKIGRITTIFDIIEHSDFYTGKKKLFHILNTKKRNWESAIKNANTQSSSQYNTQSSSQYDPQNSSQYNTQSSSQYDPQNSSQSSPQSSSQYDPQNSSQSSSQYDPQNSSQSSSQFSSQYDPQNSSQSSSQYDPQNSSQYNIQSSFQFDPQFDFQSSSSSSFGGNNDKKYLSYDLNSLKTIEMGKEFDTNTQSDIDSPIIDNELFSNGNYDMTGGMYSNDEETEETEETEDNKDTGNAAKRKDYYVNTEIQMKTNISAKFDTDTKVLVESFVDDILKEKARKKDVVNYTFFHFADTDKIGHKKTWNTTAYKGVLIEIDKYIGDMISVLRELQHETLVIITADHGGSDSLYWHHNSTNPSNFTIPFYMYKVKSEYEGKDLYRYLGKNGPDKNINPTYLDYNQPIRNGDVANYVLKVFGKRKLGHIDQLKSLMS